MAEGKSRGDVEADMGKDGFNPALLGCDPNGEGGSYRREELRS